jgi:predicted O-linked N-acetylglucosamine transferase (SPINDLY family)
MRERLMTSFDKFYDIENLSDREVIALSKKLEIDIAIDLGGHTQYTRPTIFAERVASVQINFLGYPGTLGTNYHDYIFSDKNIIPPENHKYYSEKVIYLSCYQPNDPQKYKPDRLLKKQEYGLPENKIVYCCFCNNFKILPEILESWVAILKEVKDSVLWLLEDNSVFRKNILRHFESTGIEINRIIFAPRTSLENHLDRLALADICLDTYPYNGHTTSSDALWCGIPLITVQGKSFASRVSSSLLSSVSMQKLITYSMAEYERVAISLGNIENIQKFIYK